MGMYTIFSPTFKAKHRNDMESARLKERKVVEASSTIT